MGDTAIWLLAIWALIGPKSFGRWLAVIFNSVRRNLD